MISHVDPEAIKDAAAILVAAQPDRPESVSVYARRAVLALVEQRELLVRLLGIPRPGPCGAEAPMMVGDAVDGVAEIEQLWCTLDAGHTGCHTDPRHGGMWREVTPA